MTWHVFVSLDTHGHRGSGQAWQCRNVLASYLLASTSAPVHVYTSMTDLDKVLASRVLSSHRACGYCGKRLSKAFALRRHIKGTSHHEPYRSHITALYQRNAPLCVTDSSDEYEIDKEGSRRQLASATACETETEGEAPSFSSPPDLCQLRHVRSQFSHHYADGSATDRSENSTTPIHLSGTADESRHNLQECPAWKMRMWLNAGGMPQVIPKAHIYPTGSEHSDADLFEKFYTLEPSKVRLFIDGIEDFSDTKKKRRHLASMAYRHGLGAARDQHENFRITATAVLDGDGHFHIPRIDGDAVPQYAESTEVIWAMTGGFTPMHVGKSASHTTATPAGANPTVLNCRPWETRCVCLCRSMPEEISAVASDRTQFASVRPHRLRRPTAIRSLQRVGRNAAGRDRVASCFADAVWNYP